MSNTKVVLIASGGTGGHLYPGLALARELKKMNYEPLFILRNRDLGVEILKKEKFKYETIHCIGLPKIYSFAFLKFIILFWTSLVRMRRIIADVRPRVIVGMGGYISLPVVVAGALRSVPIVLHEQNYLPGKANRFLARFAKAVALSFKDSARYFNTKNTVVTGNPVRVELFGDYKRSAYHEFHLSSDRFTVLVFGGSQGAKKINITLADSLLYLNEIKDSIQFLHIAGPDDADLLRNEYTRGGFKAWVIPYLHNIGYAYSAADFIICRAGATTVAELDILNKPALLIPFPHAAENHQEYNAQYLVNVFKGVLIKEKDLRPDIIAEGIKFQLKSHPRKHPRPVIPSPLPQQLLASLILDIFN